MCRHGTASSSVRISGSRIPKVVEAPAEGGLLHTSSSSSASGGIVHSLQQQRPWCPDGSRGPGALLHSARRVKRAPGTEDAHQAELFGGIPGSRIPNVVEVPAGGGLLHTRACSSASGGISEFPKVAEAPAGRGLLHTSAGSAALRPRPDGAALDPLRPPPPAPPPEPPRLLSFKELVRMATGGPSR